MRDQESDIPAPEPEMPVEEVPGGALHVRVSGRSDPKLFDEIATVLQHEFRGTWGGRDDSPDQRSWDLMIGEVVVTLQLERFHGIFLFPADQNSDLEKANQVVLNMVRLLQERVE